MKEAPEMEMKDMEAKIKREFDNVICVMGLIPFLALLYLLTGKPGSMELLTGNTGYIVMGAFLLLFLGVISGKQLFWNIISRLIDLAIETKTCRKTF